MNTNRLLYRISQIREEIYNLLSNNSNLLNRDVYRLSIELDELIYKYMVNIKKYEKKKKNNK